MHIGSFDQPVLLFGGVYSNLQALEALQQVAETHQIPPSNIICTGDVVAYCGQPVETVEAIQDWGIHVLMGNCEESFADNADDCGCGFGEGTQCDLLSVEWFRFANQQLRPEQREWFAQLPRRIDFAFCYVDGSLNNSHFQAQVVHGSVSQINRFLYQSHPESFFVEEFSETNASLVIAGHSGLPFTRRVGAQYWHNTGALGMPANDGTRNVWYSILAAENNKVSIQTSPLAYDFEKTAGFMSKGGLNNGYQDCLVSGLWPSVDVLPQRERAQQGKPLSPFVSMIKPLPINGE